jgi:hypothetical protein
MVDMGKNKAQLNRSNYIQHFINYVIQQFSNKTTFANTSFNIFYNIQHFSSSSSTSKKIKIQYLINKI